MRKTNKNKKKKDLAIDKALHTKLETAKKEDKRIFKLLLLGAGESGKSTLFKQMISLYGKGFSSTDRMTYLPVIQTNVISAMQVLCKSVLNYGTILPESEKLKDLIENIQDEKLTTERAEAISTLWSDPAFQKTFDRRSEFQLFDAANYFFSKVRELANENYLPTYEDILRIRVRTTGIFETEFIIESTKFKMFDVGGQRNERKKWLHCFERVTAVLFVAAISEYDQLCFEDEKTNRMEEAMALFSEICNSTYFKNTSMILFLNKRDLFQQKINQIPLNVCFKEYTLPNDYDNGTKYIQDQFFALNQNNNKMIYCHVTCATDTGNVKAVFNVVKDIVIREALEQDGFV